MNATLSVEPPARGVKLDGPMTGPEPSGSGGGDGPHRCGTRRLLRRLGAVVAGIGVFALVSSFIEPQPSRARGPDSLSGRASRTLTTALNSDDAATREQVQQRLLAARHPHGWPSLGLIEGVEYYILIHGSPDGPRYSVCSLQGRVIQADLPKDDVYRAFPTLDVEGMRLEPSVVPDGPALMLADPVGPD